MRLRIGRVRTGLFRGCGRFVQAQAAEEDEAQAEKQSADEQDEDADRVVNDGAVGDQHRGQQQEQCRTRAEKRLQ